MIFLAKLVYSDPFTDACNFIANQRYQEDHGFQLQLLSHHVWSLTFVPASKHGAIHLSLHEDLH